MTPDIKERFEKIFKHSEYCQKRRLDGIRYCSCDYDDFYTFLTSELEAQRKEIVGRLERYKKFGSCEVHEDDGNAISRLSCKNCLREQNYIRVDDAIKEVKKK